MANPHFEDFSTGRRETDGVLRLETREQAYARGVRAGAEASQAAYDAAQARALATIAEKLQGLGHTAAEARAEAVSGLGPLVCALVDTLAPQLAKQGLPAAVEAAVATALDQAASARPRVLVAPALLPGLRDLGFCRDGAVDLAADSTLAEGEVQVHWKGGYDALNLDAAVDTIRAAVAQFFATTKSKPALKVI